MKVALITGVTGQDGSYLAEFLLKKGYIVHGIKRRSSSLNTERIDHIYQDPHEENQRFKLHYGDLTDSLDITKIIKLCQPDEIYNLGAMSHVKVSFDVPEYVGQVDALGTLRILEAVPSLADWLNVHPSGDNPESYLFVNTGNNNYGKPFEYSSADKMLKRLCKKARIRKLHLYLFRHSEVTRRASKLTDGNQRSRHGWSPKSTVLAKYTHLTSKDSNDSLLRAYGIEPEKEEPDILPRICHSCKRPNSQHREICYCGRPLTVEKAAMMDKEDNEKISSIYRLLKEEGLTIQGAKKRLKSKNKESSDNSSIIKKLEKIKFELKNLKSNI